MAKTSNDKEYERGVKTGLNGDWFEDMLYETVGIFAPNNEIFDKGREWGREHRTEKKEECSSEDDHSDGQGFSFENETETSTSCWIANIIVGLISIIWISLLVLAIVGVSCLILGAILTRLGI